MAFCELHYFSQTLGISVSVNVLLPEDPENYSGEPVWNGITPLPTLYLLHGNTDDQSIWMRKTSIERYCAGKRLAVVMPVAHRCVYANQRYGVNYFDFIAEELPGVVRKYFKLSEKREENFIAGLSMGGYGAMKTALTFPNRFCAAASMSGLLNFQRFPVLEDYWEINSFEDLDRLRREKGYEAYKVAWDHISALGFAKDLSGSENDLDFLVKKLKASGAPAPQLHISIGTEDFLYDANRYFCEKLDEHNLPYVYEERPGAHTWDFWDVSIQRVLDWLPI